LNAGEVSDENVFLNLSGSIAVDDGVFFRVKAAAIAGLFTIATIVKAGCVSVVSNSQYLSKIRAGDDCADLKPMAG
jgi:hypothetical protein